MSWDVLLDKLSLGILKLAGIVSFVSLIADAGRSLLLELRVELSVAGDEGGIM